MPDLSTLIPFVVASAILARSALAYSVVKCVGAAYLIYLGVKTLRSPKEVDEPETAPNQVSRRRVSGLTYLALGASAAATESA